jgi:peroxiredoxin
VGEVDLPISKTTGLYGKPAPDFKGIIAWQDTPPIALKDLRGQVVVLDFFAYYCTLCHAHKPDLVKLREKYERDGLVVLAVHDASLKTLDEMKGKMQPILHRVFEGEPPRIPMALDGQGDRSVFGAYGIEAVPAVILIDPQGRVVRRYHHAGIPELEADVKALLNTHSELML